MQHSYMLLALCCFHHCSLQSQCRRLDADKFKRNMKKGLVILSEVSWDGQLSICPGDAVHLLPHDQC